MLEELGLVVDVGDWVISEACRQLKAWHQARVRSAEGVGEHLGAAVLRRPTRYANRHHPQGNRPATGVPELELTESILMREVSEAMQILDGLKTSA